MFSYYVFDLEDKKIKIERMYVGTVMSSLDMKGFQISVLNISQKESWLQLLDSPTSAFGWPGTAYSQHVLKPVVKSLSLAAGEEQVIEYSSNMNIILHVSFHARVNLVGEHDPARITPFPPPTS